MKIENARTKQEMHVGRAFFEEIAANEAAFDIGRAATRVTQPWLLIHGVNDESVEFEEALRLLEAVNGNAVNGQNAKLLSIENADHALGTQHPFRKRSAEFVQALDVTLGFLKRNLA